MLLVELLDGFGNNPKARLKFILRSIRRGGVGSRERPRALAHPHPLLVSPRGHYI